MSKCPRCDAPVAQPASLISLLAVYGNLLHEAAKLLRNASDDIERWSRYAPKCISEACEVTNILKRYRTAADRIESRIK